MAETRGFKPAFEKVIIVGAGPAGLLLAILLAQRRIPSIVLEAQPGLDTRLRATQYGVPATRVFKRAGILDDIRSGSIPSFPSIVWRRTADHKVLSGIDMSCVADHEDRMTIMPLNELTKVMLRHCVDGVGKGVVDVRFGHRAVGLGQDESSAWVDVEIGDGEAARKDRFLADYVIGCDGASSVVRKSLFGRNWPGQTFSHKLLVQNVWYDGFETHGWKGGNYMVDPDYWGLIARRGQGGLWRVTYGDVDGFTEEEYLKRREARLEQMLPGHPKPDQYRVGDTNFYRMHNRCVTSMRVGRVLLCADAAHICNPWGGYGCMSAVVDAGGLADCLIGLYEGKAGEDILDTYAEVRREKFLKYVDGRSIKNLERISKTDPWTVLETDKFFGILRELNGDPEATRAFLLKYSSIEYDFTQHYHDGAANDGIGHVQTEKMQGLT